MSPSTISTSAHHRLVVLDMMLVTQNRVAPHEVSLNTIALYKVSNLMMCYVYECVFNKIKLLHTCISVIQPLIPRLQSKLARHNSRYVCANNYHPNYKSLYVSNLVVIRESIDEHALFSCLRTRRIPSTIR